MENELPNVHFPDILKSYINLGEIRSYLHLVLIGHKGWSIFFVWKIIHLDLFESSSLVKRLNIFIWFFCKGK